MVIWKTWFQNTQVKQHKGRTYLLTVSEVSVFRGGGCVRAEQNSSHHNSQEEGKNNACIHQPSPPSSFIVSGSYEMGLSTVRAYLSPQLFSLEIPSQPCPRMCLARFLGISQPSQKDNKVNHHIKIITRHSASQVWQCTLSGGRSKRLIHKSELA